MPTVLPAGTLCVYTPATAIPLRERAPMAGDSAEDDWLTNVTVGSLDHPAEARVTRHIYADTQLPWYHVCEELPKLTEHDAELLIELLRAEHCPEL